MSQNKGKIAAGHKVKPHKPGVLPTPAERRRRDQLTSASDATMHVAKKLNVYDPSLPYVNASSGKLTPWLATAQDIRANLIDSGVVALSASKHGIMNDAPPEYMTAIVDRVLLKLKTGKFIWAGDLSWAYNDRDVWRDVMGQLYDVTGQLYDVTGQLYDVTNAVTVDLMVDGLIGWCDGESSHLVMTWIKPDEGFHLVCLECVCVRVDDDDSVMNNTQAVAVAAYIHAPPSSKPDMAYRINAHFYDDEGTPIERHEPASGLSARTLAIVNLVAWLMQTNDAAYVREKPVNRGARRPPLPSYRAVVPDGYVTVVEALRNRRAASEPQGGHHASPIPHDRRGSWVTNKAGKRFWRRGAKVLGGAEKAAQGSLPIRGHYEVRT